MSFGGALASSVDPDATPGEQVVLVQFDHGNGGRSLSGVVAGDLLVAMMAVRGTLPLTPSGYTRSPEGDVSQSNGDRALAYYKIADGTETTFILGVTQYGGCWYEVSGPLGTVRANVSASGSGSVASTPSVSVSEGDIAFLICTIGEGGAFDSGNHSNAWTPSGAWIEDHDLEIPDGHPAVFIGHQIIGADGDLAGSATFTHGPDAWAAQLIVFVGAAVEFESIATGWGA